MKKRQLGVSFTPLRIKSRGLAVAVQRMTNNYFKIKKKRSEQIHFFGHCNLAIGIFSLIGILIA